jgi:phosphate transport system protein
MQPESEGAELRRSFHHELDRLEARIVDMGELVKSRLGEALRALSEKNMTLARAVAQGDDEVNDLELEIEQQCLRLLALQQPLASDLRRISTVLKLITDLERMGDHAKDISRAVLRIGDEPLMKPLVDIPRMGELGCEMLADALEAYTNHDIDGTLEMIEKDHELDHLYNQLFRELLTYMIEDPRHIRQATHLLFIGSYLERFGDHATNLGEWVVFLVTGQRYDFNV